MAHDIRLYSASYLAELDDGTVFGIQHQLGSLGTPAVQYNYAQVWGRGHHPLAGVSYGNREITLTLQLRGTSQDNWATNHRNVTQMLLLTRQYHETAGVTGERATLSVQLDGQTYAVEFDVLTGEFDAGAVFDPMMNTTATPMILAAPLTLTVKPFAHPQVYTRVTSPSITNGGGTTNATNAYQLTAPLGDIAAPVKLTVQPTTVIKRVILGRKTQGNLTNFKSRFECETATYAGYNVASVVAGETSNNVEASGSNGNVARVVSTREAGVLRWTIESNVQDYFGDYRVFLRVFSLGTTATIKFLYGGTSGEDIANTSVSITSGGPQLVDLGKMSIPHRIGPPDVPLANFKFSLGWISGAASAYVDCVYLVPIDEQYADLGWSAALGASDQIVLDSLIPVPAVYVQDASGDLQPEYPIDGSLYTNWELEPGRDNLIVPLVCTSTGLYGHNLGTVFTLEADYHPLYQQFRTS